MIDVLYVKRTPDQWLWGLLRKMGDSVLGVVRESKGEGLGAGEG